MPDELVPSSSGKIAKERDLIYFLEAFDAHSLNLFTEGCLHYNDEQLNQVLELLETMKQKSWLYQWAVIAVKAYQIYNAAGDKPVNLVAQLKRTFPALGKSPLYKKFRAWRIFYQDPNVTDRAAWNGQSYVFETASPRFVHVESPSEAWYFHAMHCASSPEEAVELLREGERRFLEMEMKGVRYTTHQFYLDLRYRRGKKNIVPPFGKFMTMVGNVVRELASYLESYDYTPEYNKLFLQLYHDISFIARECAVLAGEWTREEFKDSLSELYERRIDDSGVFDVDLSYLIGEDE